MTAKSLVSVLAVIGSVTVVTVLALAGRTAAAAEPMPASAPVSPTIAGLTSLTDKQEAVLLTTDNRRRSTGRLPVLEFRPNEEDAQGETTDLCSPEKKS